MKKYLFISLLLAIAGAVFSGILTHQHFYDTSEVAAFFCGESFNNPCKALSMTEYSTLFGVPVAVYGMLFYSFIVITLLIADYAKGAYYRTAVAVILPLAGLALIGDIILFIIIIAIEIYCPLCITTYVINMALFIAITFWYREIKKNDDTGLMDIYRAIVSSLRSVPDRKAAFSSFLLFSLFFTFSFILTSQIMETKTADQRRSYQHIKKYLNEYYNTAPENITLPDSKIVVGNKDAVLNITVYTDFLCSFCYKLYVVEEYLQAKFGDKIRFEYYSYPLDQECNPNVSRTVYKHSCESSKAMYAAAEAGLAAEYMRLHFHNYKKIKAAYNKDIAVRLFNQLGTKADTGRFIKAYDSKTVSDIIARDIETAKSAGIRSTPTMFIGNRRITGARPKEVLEVIIRDALSRKN